VVGNAAIGSPLQIGFTCVKVGVVFGVIVIVIVCVVAHNPAVGVNVYTVVEVLFIAGDQVPVTPLFDVVGNAASGSPLQIGFTCVNVGVVFGVTVIVIVVVGEHNPAVGVKV
jgi:F0F1-type ATP synthase membrane subunit c/vacuolar-type H+-ATPase subunit K